MTFSKDDTISEILLMFESLGNNCEFGIVQRQFGCDPPGLFRNVGFLSPEQMITALMAGLDGMFEQQNYEFTLPTHSPDWRLHCRIFGFQFHTGIKSSILSNSDEWIQQTHQNMVIFRFLKKKFIQHLCVNKRIFVFRFNEVVPEDTARRMYAAIRSHGDGSLLYVSQNITRPYGCVVKRENGLIYAEIPHLANENPPVIDFKAWESITYSSVSLRRGLRSVE